ncbi:MAG: shikimate kinase [Desulfovibrio sp.]|nr:shikimate kinase [Desulfovibrio sp.]
MSSPELLTSPPKLAPCVILIGMAGAGKSTVGSLLARELGWAFLDSDHVMEALYGARLQDITDAMDKESFLDVEAAVICSIRAHRTVIGTGGSVVYREAAMRHLAGLGCLVHLDVPLGVIEERIARNPERGLAIAPGQTLADIFYEREALYARWRQLHCLSQNRNARQCALWIRENLPPHILCHDSQGETSQP